jgi:hypothetical protein
MTLLVSPEDASKCHVVEEFSRSTKASTRHNKNSQASQLKSIPKHRNEIKPLAELRKGGHFTTSVEPGKTQTSVLVRVNCLSHCGRDDKCHHHGTDLPPVRFPTTFLTPGWN